MIKYMYSKEVSYIMETKIISKTQYNLVVNSLKNGDVVSFPTETVMGLAVDAFNKDAYHKLIEIKNRPANKAFPFIVKDISNIEKYAYLNDKAQEIINKFLPGPLTIILRKKESVPAYITNNQESIAIRIPNDETVMKILNEFDSPILLTSANKSGEAAATNSKECFEVFNDEIEYIIDGECLIKEASTIIDLRDQEIKLVREGKIKIEDIRKVIGE